MRAAALSLSLLLSAGGPAAAPAPEEVGAPGEVAPQAGGGSDEVAPQLGGAPVEVAPQAGGGSGDAGAADVPTRGVTSLVVRPLYLAERPPDARSLRNLHLVTSDAEGAPEGSPTREEARALARALAEEARSGADFEDLARAHSAARNARDGAVLGTFPRGLLQPEMDDFLFSAELGEVSEPIENELGVHLLQRVERWAGARKILVSGRDEESREGAEEVLARLRAGEDFRDVAREVSDDAASAGSGGDHRIFERGPRDRLLKEAVFRARIGEVVGPIESPLGLHFVQRVPVEDLDPALAERVFVRARAILVSHDNTPLGGVSAPRTMVEAFQLAESLHARIADGEDMAALARELNDDPTGSDRAGDLGWIHRGHTGTASFVKRLWPLRDGELLEPVRTDRGWVVVRKEASASGM